MGIGRSRERKNREKREKKRTGNGIGGVSSEGCGRRRRRASVCD
jgi:hypothetical protein